MSTISTSPKSIKTSEFKAKCLRLMDEVVETGVPVVIAKIGRPVAQLRPAVSRPPTLAGAHQGKIEIAGDIIAPIDVDREAGR